MKNDLTNKQFRKHGQWRSPTYYSWASMTGRCFNKNLKEYKNYGGRGVTVCSDWRNFECFYKDMGERPSRLYSLGRINNDGNYEPKNCRWETRSAQNRNRRPNKTNISNALGVCWESFTKKWLVQIGKKKIGRFSNLQNAINARKQAERSLGWFQHLGV